MDSSQRNLIINSLSEPTENVAKSLVQFLGAIHDWGKATPAFQIQQSWPVALDLDRDLVERLERFGFNGIANATLPERSRTPHALAGQVLMSWYGINDDISSIIGGHHGRPIDSDQQYTIQGAYLENYYQDEKPDSLIYQKWKRTQEEVLNWALETSGFESVESLPQISQPGQVVLSGMLIMADWLASNEDYFPLIDIDSYDIANQMARINSAWSKWYKNQPWEAQNKVDIFTHYDERFKFSPRDVQLTLSEVIDETDDPGIFILEAPMGEGKTEAALIGVEQLAAKLGLSGMFFGLPTQATSDGIFPRISEWLDSVASENEDREKLAIRLMHGKAALNNNFNSISKNIDIDGDKYSNVYVNEWFSGRKKTSLDDFVVGTVDQLLLLALKQKHVVLRHLGFSKKVVVIDEVHSYDAYMSEYLQSALQWLGAYGVPVIILSATLAASVRASLIKAYMNGSGVKLSKGILQDEMFTTTAYPLITYTDGDDIFQAKNMTVKNKKTVDIIRVDEEDLFSLINDLSESDGVIGVVVNTVKRAQELARYCVSQYGEDRVELLHSNFIATHRVRKEENLINMIGKNVKRPRNKIIIGTQVIEQSLDINFDVLISDLAPVDLLIQRVGRLHRHDIEYPIHFERPTLYLVGTNEELDFNGGSSAVYGDYLLARTQYFLKDFIRLPEDISPLVQAVYGTEDIKGLKNLEDKYFAFKKQHQELIKQKSKKAKRFKLSKPNLRMKASVNLIGWLNAAPIDLEEEAAHTQVRDTKDTIEIIALKEVGNGYGIIGKDEDISGLISDYQTGIEIAKQTIRLPYYLSGQNTIDFLEEYTLDKFRGWQEQPWLRGLLGIIFDENLQFNLNGQILQYDTKYGLTILKKEG